MDFRAIPAKPNERIKVHFSFSGVQSISDNSPSFMRTVHQQRFDVLLKIRVDIWHDCSLQNHARDVIKQNDEFIINSPAVYHLSLLSR